MILCSKFYNMKSIFFLPVLLISVYTAKAQTMPPRHYISVFGGAEWSSLSITAGAEYEHMLSFSGKSMVSLKLFALVPYEYGNFAIFSRSEYEGRVFHAGMLVSGNFYLNNTNECKGFYLTVGAGPGFSRVKQEVFEILGIKQDVNNRLKFAAETGMGIQYPLSKKTDIRAGVSTRWGVFIGGYTAAHLSIGF